jgi:hypothetical protein
LLAMKRHGKHEFSCRNFGLALAARYRTTRLTSLSRVSIASRMSASRFGWWLVAKAPCPTRAAGASCRPVKTGNPARRCYFAIGCPALNSILITMTSTRVPRARRP